jgi:hypothetical protein
MRRLFSVALYATLVASFIVYLPNDKNLSIVQAQDFKNYTNSHLYTIRYPSGWLIDKSSTKDYVTLWNRLPPSRRELGQSPPLDLIKTELSVHRQADFDQVVSDQPRIEKRSGVKVTLRQNIEVNAMQAIRIFGSDVPFDFPNSIVTIFRYSENEVVFVSSYYDARNTEAREIILQLHNSFRKF